MDNPICPECDVPMKDYSKPQRPCFVCPECDGDQNGIETEWCECGDPVDLCSCLDCDCDVDEDYDGTYQDMCQICGGETPCNCHNECEF